MDFWISLGIKFHLILTFSVFWTKFLPKGYFRSKTKENEHHHWILHIFELVYVPNCTFKNQFWILGQNLRPQKRFSVENGKSEYHHGIGHIQVSLSTKFQIKLKIFIFWNKLAQKGYLRSKTEKPHFCVRPWSLRTMLNLSAWGPRGTTSF